MAWLCRDDATQHTLHQNRFRNGIHWIRPEIDVSAFRRCDAPLNEFSLYKLYIVLQSPVAGRRWWWNATQREDRERKRSRKVMEKCAMRLWESRLRFIRHLATHTYACTAMQTNMNAFEYVHAVLSIKFLRIHVVCRMRYPQSAAIYITFIAN